ncbi:hypothetical protein C3L33_03042, partial [Rhododendron williamsianum]
MVKESARKCSHCGNNGHNSRTCCNGKSGVCVKLFGVNILAEKKGEDSMRKCKSMGNIVACHGEIVAADDDGYSSDGPVHSRRAHERKKGVPWTEDEHRAFLAGLERLGKGDWRGISKNHVRSRTPTQVASHAQKYFIRLTSGDKKKRRTSLFDMSVKKPGTHDSPPPQVPPDRTAEILPQGDDSPVAANLNHLGHSKTQAIGTSAEVARPLEVTPVVPIAASYGVPDFRQMPYMPMVGVPSIGQNFPGATDIPTVSFVPVMNIPNHGYFYMPNSYGNYATCAPYMSQSPRGLLPQQLLHGPSQAGPLNFSG